MLLFCHIKKSDGRLGLCIGLWQIDTIWHDNFHILLVRIFEKNVDETSCFESGFCATA